MAVFFLFLIQVNFGREYQLDQGQLPARYYRFVVIGRTIGLQSNLGEAARE